MLPRKFVRRSVTMNAPTNEFDTLDDNGTVVTSDDTQDVRLSCHNQLLMDRQTAIENELAGEIRWLDCEARKTKHNVAVATAHVNTFLAAHQLGLPRCARIIAKGEFAFIEQCSVHQVNLTTTWDKCGATLQWNNMTVSPNGYELMEFTPCSIKGGAVHVAGKVYSYSKGYWEVIQPKTILPNHELAHLYRYENDNSLSFSVKHHAMDNREDFLDQYASIAFERFEEVNSIAGLPVPGSLWAAYWKSWSYWDIALVIIALLFLLIILLITCMCAAKCGIFRFVEDTCIAMLCCCCRCCVAAKKNKKAEREMIPLNVV